MNARIEVELDCRNTRLQKDEIMYFKMELEKLFKCLGIKIVDIKVFR